MTNNDSGKDHIHQTHDDSPSARFIMKILLDATKLRYEKIHFDPAKADDGLFAVFAENDGQLKEIAAGPIQVWSHLILRLRFVAGFDTRGSEAREGNFLLPLSKNRAVRFQVLANPYPEPKKKVTIINKSVDEAPTIETPSQSIEEVEKRIRELQKQRIR